MKSKWGRLILVPVIALGAGILAPGSGYAATKACPSDLASAGFVDLDGLSEESTSAIDCVAHYNITTGTGFLTYSPHVAVPRWQMAIFLARTAQALGLSLPSPTPQGFIDVPGIEPAAQIAINQITEIGLASGTSRTTFSPHQRMPRWQMAIFVSRLLERAGIEMPAGHDYGFTDLSNLSAEATTAINQIARLGVASGTSPTTFSPHQTMPRWQMAIFLANALQAAGADPYGVKLTLSANSAPVNGLVVATIRITGSEGKPLAGQLVDVFVASSLKSDGTCAVDTDASVDGGDAGSSVDCEIDWADPKSDSEGKVTVLLTHELIAEKDHVYAWIGPLGQVFDADVVDDFSTASIAWSAVASSFQVTTPQSAGFGDAVTVTASLTADGSPVWGERIHFSVERGGARILTQAVFTAADGTASINYAGPGDPTAGDDPPVLDMVLAFWDRDGDGLDDGGVELDAATTVTWDD